VKSTLRFINKYLETFEKAGLHLSLQKWIYRGYKGFGRGYRGFVLGSSELKLPQKILLASKMVKSDLKIVLFLCPVSDTHLPKSFSQCARTHDLTSQNNTHEPNWFFSWKFEHLEFILEYFGQANRFVSVGNRYELQQLRLVDQNKTKLLTQQ